MKEKVSKSFIGKLISYHIFWPVKANASGLSSVILTTHSDDAVLHVACLVDMSFVLLLLLPNDSAKRPYSIRSNTGDVRATVREQTRKRRSRGDCRS